MGHPSERRRWLSQLVKLEQVLDLKNSHMGGYYGDWLGLAPDDSPLLLRDTGNQEIYALDWEMP